MTPPAGTARRPPLPGPRQRGAPADRPALPGVDRAQRLRPRDHAGRAVRLDDRHDHLPAQPRPREAPRDAARPARDRAARADRGAHARPLPPRGAARAAGRDPARRRPRSGRCAPPRGVDRLPGQRGLHDPAGAPDGLRGQARRAVQGRSLSPTASRSRRAPTSCRSAARRRPATRSTSASTRTSRTSCSRSTIDCSKARGAGVDPEDPPLRWEVSQGGDGGPRPRCSSDLTGGFNYGSGNVEVQCPADAGAASLAGHRCPGSAAGSTRRPARGDRGRLHAPAGDPLDHGRADRRDHAGRALRAGGRGVARHQRRHARAAVRAALLPDPPARPTERRSRSASPAATVAAVDAVESFAESGPDDRHFKLDATAGGRARPRRPPARRRLAAVRRVPQQGADLRMNRYRHGGGREGNVAADTLDATAQRDPRGRLGDQPAPGLRRRRSRVAGLSAAAGGDGDPHALSRGHGRGLRVPRRRGLPARRAHVCISPQAPTDPMRVHILPQVAPADRRLTLEELTPDEDLLSEVGRISTGAA